MSRCERQPQQDLLFCQISQIDLPPDRQRVERVFSQFLVRQILVQRPQQEHRPMPNLLPHGLKTSPALHRHTAFNRKIQVEPAVGPDRPERF